MQYKPRPIHQHDQYIHCLKACVESSNVGVDVGPIVTTVSGVPSTCKMLSQNGMGGNPSIINAMPNAIISAEACALIEKEFQSYVNLKQQSEIARPIWQQRLKDFAKENEEDVDHSLDEIIEDIEEMKRSEQKITLEDIFQELMTKGLVLLHKSWHESYFSLH